MELNYGVDRSNSQMDRVIEYLARQAETESDYIELIESLNLVREFDITSKPVVKILSPSATLAENFTAKNLNDFQLRSLFEFQVVLPSDNLRQIVQNCDLICPIYYFKHRIPQHHLRAIELARHNNLNVILLVRQPDTRSENTSLADWLAARDCSFDSGVQFPLDNFIDLDNSQHLNICQQQFVRLWASARRRFELRINLEYQSVIRDFFNLKLLCLRQEIEQMKDSYVRKKSNFCQQQIRVTIERYKREKQQIITAIKQDINCSKSDLVNPFQADSLAFMVQQLIYFSQVKIVRETDNTYLYLTRDDSAAAEYIHDYILELCQQKLDEMIISQWERINCICVKYNLPAMIDWLHRELSYISPQLGLEAELPLASFSQESGPSLDLKQTIDPDCLKLNSRIVFDYHFTQGSWFRLGISVLVGLGIYLFTWIYFGSGKYIGFIMVFFQIINLITNQNVKTVRLKQHSKELKRIVDAKYQSLVRQVIDKFTQTTIATIDREAQLERAKLEKAIAIIREELPQPQQTIDRHQTKIEFLKQDRDKILAWIEEGSTLTRDKLLDNL